MKLAIVGRPNVGKSTLFNRLAGKKLALVDDRPGVTRDRREGDGKLGDLRFTLIDTAGLEAAAAAGSLSDRMRTQTRVAVDAADICLFLIDAREGLTEADREVAGMLRQAGRETILLANKCESRASESGFLEAYELGLGEPIAFSAEHGQGLGDLYDRLVELGVLPDHAEKAEDADLEDDEIRVFDESAPLRLAIVGRPNVGKSTLINHLLGEERLLTGPEAGITRDSIGIEWEWQGHRIKLFDTAGMRRRAKVHEKLEKLSVADSLRAIRFAEVVLVTLDATMPFERQDLHIADLVEQEGRGLLIVVNKWDLVEEPQAKLAELNYELNRLLPQIRGVPIVTLSAVTGKGVQRLLPKVMEIYRFWNTRIPTAKLNRWLEDAAADHPPPAPRGRPISLKYVTQVKARPPTFALFSSRAPEIPTSYQRYLVNSLRETFSLPAVPIRLFLRKPDNPYANRKKR